MGKENLSRDGLRTYTAYIQSRCIGYCCMRDNHRLKSLNQHTLTLTVSVGQA